MSKHTPGPWRVGESCRTADIKAGYNALIARVEIESAGDRGDANARLIAAAPDLLEVCKRVRDGLDAGEHPGQFASMLDAAIRKAEGGEA